MALKKYQQLELKMPICQKKKSKRMKKYLKKLEKIIITHVF